MPTVRPHHHGPIAGQERPSRTLRREVLNIGNEMYGNWQLGHIPLGGSPESTTNSPRPCGRSIRRSNSSASATRASRTNVRNCADHINLLSEHFYCSA